MTAYTELARLQKALRAPLEPEDALEPPRPYWKPCGECEGRGWEANNEPCDSCMGVGEVEVA